MALGHVSLAVSLATAAPVSAQVATISVVDSAGEVGRGSDVAYGPDRLALISYVDSTNGALKVAHCNGTAVAIWSCVSGCRGGFPR